MSDLKEIKPTINGNTISVKLTTEQMNRISGVRSVIGRAKVRKENGQEILSFTFCGANTDMKSDWQSGEFESTFDGTELYSAPIILNDRPCNVLVSCSYPDEIFSIVGAQPQSDNNIPSDELYSLKKGDCVQMRYLKWEAPLPKINEQTGKVQESGELLMTFYDSASTTFTIDDSGVNIGRGILPRGYYFYYFEFVNPIGGRSKNALATAEGFFIMNKDHELELKPFSEFKFEEDVFTGVLVKCEYEKV